MLVISTSEANRAAYRDLGQAQNDIAAGAESRAIEYSAQTQLVLRTPPGHPDVVHVKVAKNRRALRGELFLKLDGEFHELTQCTNPVEPADTDSKEQAKVEKDRQFDAAAERIVRDVLLAHPSTFKNKTALAAACLGIRTSVKKAVIERMIALHQIDIADGFLRMVPPKNEGASHDNR